ncbi:hypothetical protein EBN03_31225 [Nocardia stercoris]|uniref:Uncharacterized protein n=1 Tax=Nocardia stercoris TaxID=2483361 RepID=A0A3M2KTE4_9NOCA|nr:hypothetical protein EBN03_31225 [Nocardia stercoris]
MPAGPAQLPIDTGAPLLPVHRWLTPDGWGFHVSAPIGTTDGVQATTQALADRFAIGIAAHPADWHMLQPVWNADHRAREQARSSPHHRSGRDRATSSPSSRRVPQLEPVGREADRTNSHRHLPRRRRPAVRVVDDPIDRPDPYGRHSRQIWELSSQIGGYGPPHAMSK